ncbi:MAG TPA: nuclear transport factor 2 family protein [Vicinamibacterales bacterium]|nr:nuclear transport factor 2 family protein [Vicinamibacterales bacterium]
MNAHAVGDVITRMLHAVDSLDWAGVRERFRDPVSVDYSSLTGQPAAMVPRDDLIEGWRGVLPGFDATQHITGPIAVDDESADEAVARTTVRGYHWLGSDEWMVAGRYTMTLVRTGSTWRITAITLTVSHQSGTLSLPETARARAATRPREPSNR